MDLFLIAASDGGGRRRDDPVDHRGDLRHPRNRDLDPRRGALRHRPDHRRSVDRTWRRQYLLLIGVTPFPAKEPGRRLSRCGAFRVNDWSSWSSN